MRVKYHIGESCSQCITLLLSKRVEWERLFLEDFVPLVYKVSTNKNWLKIHFKYLEFLNVYSRICPKLAEVSPVLAYLDTLSICFLYNLKMQTTECLGVFFHAFSDIDPLW